MRNLMKKTVALWLVIAWVGMLGAALAEEGSAGILYKVQNKETTVYLLGSIHVGNQEMYPFGETILKAMEASDVFVFECDTTSGDALQVTLQMMYYQDTTRMQDVVSEPLYQKLAEACKKQNKSIRIFEKMRPWAAMTQFAVDVTAAEMGAANASESVKLGVETAVQRFVAENQKATQYLETVEAQLKMLDRMSMPLQEYLLDDTLNAILHPEAIAGMDKTLRYWPTWWRDGDISAFADSYQANYISNENGLYDEPTAELLAEYHRVLVTERNQTMADTVDGYLRAGEKLTYFATVGLLHLVLPEDSILTHLQGLGYSVECLSIP